MTLYEEVIVVRIGVSMITRPPILIIVSRGIIISLISFLIESLHIYLLSGAIVFQLILLLITIWEVLVTLVY